MHVEMLLHHTWYMAHHVGLRLTQNSTINNESQSWRKDTHNNTQYVSNLYEHKISSLVRLFGPTSNDDIVTNSRAFHKSMQSELLYFNFKHKNDV